MIKLNFNLKINAVVDKEGDLNEVSQLSVKISKGSIYYRESFENLSEALKAIDDLIVKLREKLKI